jgi:DNA-binding IclR family transcriptional regulator
MRRLDVDEWGACFSKFTVVLFLPNDHSCFVIPNKSRAQLFPRRFLNEPHAMTKTKNEPVDEGQSARQNRRPSRVLPAYSEFAGDKQFATTLARGLALLKCFTPAQPVLANKELCAMTGLPKGTISRLTYTLCQLGYLRAEPGSARYELGSAVVSIGYPLLANVGLRQLARPLMNELADYVRGSVSMGIRDRLNMVFIETSRSLASYSSKLADIGLTYPISATALGWAYLAACDEAEQQALLNEIRVKAPQEWESHGPNLQRALKNFSRTGFCASYGDLRPEVVAVAVPYPGMVNGRHIVFNCVMHAFRVTREQVEKDIGPRLVSMVRSLPG